LRQASTRARAVSEKSQNYGFIAFRKKVRVNLSLMFSALDKIGFEYLHQFAGRFKLLDFLGIFLAQYLPYLLILALIVFLVRRRPLFRFLAFIVLAILLARGLLTDLIRIIYPSPRPFLELGFAPLIEPSDSFSFPSGHAAIFFALAFSLWLINKKWGIFFFAAAILIGLGRVFVGVHWPLDIIGGFLVSAFSVVVVKWILPLDKKIRRNREI